jgi:hypothetical protein
MLLRICAELPEFTTLQVQHDAWGATVSALYTIQIVNHSFILCPTFIFTILFNYGRRYFSINEVFLKNGTADERK